MTVRKTPVLPTFLITVILCGIAVIAGTSTAMTITCASLLVVLVSLFVFVRVVHNSNQIEHEHQIMVETVRQYPMPLAIYDVDDRLVVWNDAYESLYEKAFSKLEDWQRAKPLYYIDLIRSNVPQELSGEERERYIQRRLRAQQESTGEAIDRNYPIKGWFRVSKFRTPSGAVAGFAIDINELKDREQILLQEVERRKVLESKILALAYSDELTGVANRRAILEHAEKEFQRCHAQGEPLSILMLDIDHFKSINDQYGHTVGDEVIKSVCCTIDENLRIGTDKIGRIGGEEFAVVVLRATAASAASLADTIRKNVEELKIDANGKILTVTVSIGIAQLLPADTELVQLINRADESLYVAKNAGRNQVRAA